MLSHLRSCDSLPGLYEDPFLVVSLLQQLNDATKLIIHKLAFSPRGVSADVMLHIYVGDNKLEPESNDDLSFDAAIEELEALRILELEEEERSLFSFRSVLSLFFISYRRLFLNQTFRQTFVGVVTKYFFPFFTLYHQWTDIEIVAQACFCHSSPRT
jgi:hypothetical protein